MEKSSSHLASSDLPEEDPLVRKIISYNEKPLWLHGYILFFMPVYAVWMYFWLASDSIFPSYELAMIVLAGIGVVQTLMVLSCVWSVNIRCLLTCSVVSGSVLGCGGRLEILLFVLQFSMGVRRWLIDRMPTCSVHGLIDWLADWLLACWHDRLIGWLIGSLIGTLIGCLIDRFIDYLVIWLFAYQWIDWLIAGLIRWLFGSLVVRWSIDWPVDSLISRLIDGLIDQPIDWLTGFYTDWLNWFVIHSFDH